MSTSRQPIQDAAPDVEKFREDVLDGLRRSRKSLPCKYFYDERGSELFEQICELDEYYLTRTELAIMEAHAEPMAARLGPRCLLIEYGSGTSRKTRLLLDHLERPAGYVPVDISRSVLERSSAALGARYPSLAIHPVCADYTDRFELPRPDGAPTRCTVYFPGSTIGNLSPPEARSFLKGILERVGPEGAFLGGIDLKKDPDVLEAAYNDRNGVTARFNLNLLARMNRELGADFDLERFRHHAFFNEALGRIEMHLVSEADQEVSLGDVAVRFDAGESIHTESSYKYDPDDFAALATDAGFEVHEIWTDPERLFSVQYLKPA